MKVIHLSVLIAVLLLAAPAWAQQSSAAGFETRLSTLEDELRATNGQVEQLGYSIRRLDQSVQRLQTDYDARLTRLETSVSALNAEAAARAAAPPPPAESVLGATKASTPLPPEATLSPQEAYDRAFNLLRQARYEDAEKAFKDFIDNNPKDKLLDNAKYWRAETLYARQHFAEAATGFADAFQQNPQGNKAPDSLLKLAMSLTALNRAADACTALGELKTKYPNASSTVKTRATEQRAKLKCG